MKCRRYHGKLHAYQLVKCRSCGTVSTESFGKLSKGWKLKITADRETGEIWIRGNKAGLEFLANCCLRIIGKTDPSGHILLEWQMCNLLEGSTETRLEYSDSEEDYQD